MWCSPTADGKVVQAAMRQGERLPATPIADLNGNRTNLSRDADANTASNIPTTGTVVLDVEQGGLEVPSFVGKTVRNAVEAAQDAGLEIEAVGSGVARQQSPAAGTHVAAGAHVMVQFGR